MNRPGLHNDGNRLASTLTTNPGLPRANDSVVPFEQCNMGDVHMAKNTQLRLYSYCVDVPKNSEIAQSELKFRAVYGPENQSRTVDPSMITIEEYRKQREQEAQTGEQISIYSNSSSIISLTNSISKEDLMIRKIRTAITHNLQLGNEIIVRYCSSEVEVDRFPHAPITYGILRDLLIDTVKIRFESFYNQSKVLQPDDATVPIGITYVCKESDREAKRTQTIVMEPHKNSYSRTDLIPQPLKRDSQLEGHYFFRLPHVYIIADYVWPGITMFAQRVMGVRHMKFDESDIVIASYPKSGTTWMAELVSGLNYNGDTEELCKLRQDEPVPWLELDSEYWWIKIFYQWKRYFGEDHNILPKDNRCHAPGTKYRLCFTHLPLELLPKSVLHEKCKLIYVARNPKDNAVIFFHFLKTARFLGLQTWIGIEFFALYQNIYCGSWFEHVLGYWKFANSPAQKDRGMSCKFEDMKDDLPCEISRIASFINIELTEEQKKKVLNHCLFGTMKNNKMANRDTVWLFDQKISKFMRKGQVGDWRNYFTFVQSEAFDEIYKENMNGTGLDFRFD